MKIKTKDLWESAYLMAEGGTLEDVEVDCSRGKRETIFILNIYGLENIVKDFALGHAICNVAQLRANVNRLRDVVFRHVGR